MGADQARDVDIDNSIRTGRAQARADKAFVVKRVEEGKNRLEKDVKDFVSKAYWYDAKQELRRQLGYMSLDMDTLIAASGDKKKRDAGLKYQAEALTKLNDFIAFAT